MDGVDDYWLLLTLALPPADRRGGRADGQRALLLHVLHEWLTAEHRVPALLPDTAARRGCDTVTVSFRGDEVETALAFRSFCSGLGVGQQLTQWHVRPHHCPRTTPRRRGPADTRAGEQSA